MWLTENIESGLSVTVVASKASLTGPVAPVGHVWIIDLWQQDYVFSSHTHSQRASLAPPSYLPASRPKDAMLTRMTTLARPAPFS